jgi:hypothetical protein
MGSIFGNGFIFSNGTWNSKARLVHFNVYFLVIRMGINRNKRSCNE